MDKSKQVQDLNVNKAPVSCRVGKQLSGLYMPVGHQETEYYSATLAPSGVSESSTAALCERNDAVYLQNSNTRTRPR